MPDAHDLASPCPHCGFLSEDSELCQACGKIMDTSFPEQSFSAGELAARITASWHSCQDVEALSPIKEEPEFCPTWDFNPGNIYHKDR